MTPSASPPTTTTLVLEVELDAMQLEMNTMRQELGEAQERIDFAERMLAQGPGAGPLNQSRQVPQQGHLSCRARPAAMFTDLHLE